MKRIFYNLCTKANHGTQKNPVWVENLAAVEMPWSEANEKIAKREAHNGEYTVEDDGLPEPEATSDSDGIYKEMAAAYNEGVQGA